MKGTDVQNRRVSNGRDIRDAYLKMRRMNVAWLGRIGLSGSQM